MRFTSRAPVRNIGQIMNDDYKKQIEQLKDSIRIEDVIGAYVHLKHKASGKILGLCPFHDDSTPSMHVVAKKKYFKCFACDEGGDVFSFIQKKENCSFAEAVKIIRDRWGGPSFQNEQREGNSVPHKHKVIQHVRTEGSSGSNEHGDHGSDQHERRSVQHVRTEGSSVSGEHEDDGSVPLIMTAPQKFTPKPAPEEASPALLAAMEAANLNFLKTMSGHHPELAYKGDPAFEFAGVSHETHAPCLDFAGVKPAVPTGKYHPDCYGIVQTYVDFEVSMAGRSVPRGMERFAGRIIFPIRDENGRLVGFSGRITFDPTPEQKKKTSKYMNSSTSALFKKSHLLYGMHKAGNFIRNEGVAFLVEGYKDVIAMVAGGFPNTVAQCGAAFTQEQAQLLKKYTKRVAVLMDADERGRDIAAAAIQMLQKNGIQTSDLVLPKGDDPDSLFRRLGRQAFRVIVRESQLSDQLQVARADALQKGIQADGIQATTSPNEEIQLGSDRPRLKVKEQELQIQIRSLNNKRFLTGPGPDRVLLNTELMKLRSQLSEVSKQLNRPAVWY